MEVLAIIARLCLALSKKGFKVKNSASIWEIMSSILKTEWLKDNKYRIIGIYYRRRKGIVFKPIIRCNTDFVTLF